MEKSSNYFNFAKGALKVFEKNPRIVEDLLLQRMKLVAIKEDVNVTAEKE